MRRVVLIGILQLIISGIQPGNATTINFEGNNLDFTPIPFNAYSALGVEIFNGEYFRCHGGCPPPDTGFFASTPDLGIKSPLTVLFQRPQQTVSFVNVTASFLKATVYDNVGNILNTVISNNTTGQPVPLALTASGIAQIVFSSSGDIHINGGEMGIDDLTFDFPPLTRLYYTI